MGKFTIIPKKLEPKLIALREQSKNEDEVFVLLFFILSFIFCYFFGSFLVIYIFFVWLTVYLLIFSFFKHWAP